MPARSVSVRPWLTRKRAWLTFKASLKPRFALPPDPEPEDEGNAAWRALADDEDFKDDEPSRTEPEAGYGLRSVRRGFMIGFHSGWTAAGGVFTRKGGAR